MHFTMDETIYVVFKVQFVFALEVWFSIYISAVLATWVSKCHTKDFSK